MTIDSSETRSISQYSHFSFELTPKGKPSLRSAPSSPFHLENAYQALDYETVQKGCVLLHPLKGRVKLIGEHLDNPPEKAFLVQLIFSVYGPCFAPSEVIELLESKMHSGESGLIMLLDKHEDVLLVVLERLFARPGVFQTWFASKQEIILANAKPKFILAFLKHAIHAFHMPVHPFSHHLHVHMVCDFVTFLLNSDQRELLPEGFAFHSIALGVMQNGLHSLSLIKSYQKLILSLIDNKKFYEANQQLNTKQPYTGLNILHAFARHDHAETLISLVDACHKAPLVFANFLNLCIDADQTGQNFLQFAAKHGKDEFLLQFLESLLKNHVFQGSIYRLLMESSKKGDHLLQGILERRFVQTSAFLDACQFSARDLFKLLMQRKDGKLSALCTSRKQISHHFYASLQTILQRTKLKDVHAVMWSLELTAMDPHLFQFIYKNCLKQLAHDHQLWMLLNEQSIHNLLCPLIQLDTLAAIEGSLVLIKLSKQTRTLKHLAAQHPEIKKSFWHLVLTKFAEHKHEIETLESKFLELMQHATSTLDRSSCVYNDLHQLISKDPELLLSLKSHERLSPKIKSFLAHFDTHNHPKFYGFFATSLSPRTGTLLANYYKARLSPHFQEDA